MAMQTISFSIENQTFGETDFITVLRSGVGQCFVYQIGYDETNQNNSWIKYSIPVYKMSLYNDKNIEKILFTYDYDEDIFSKSANGEAITNLYFTYNIIYDNKGSIIESSRIDYRIKEDNEKNKQAEIINIYENDIEEQAKAFLSTWFNVDSVKITNELIDEHHHIIVGNNRNIILPQSDGGQIIISKDSESQEITFEIPRLYDGVDLSKKKISIYYIRPDDIENGIQEELKIENIGDNVIEASWVINEYVTVTSGILTFAIIVEGKDETDDYFWQTFPSNLTIAPGIYDKLPSNKGEFAFVTPSEQIQEILEDLEFLKEKYEQGIILWQKIPLLQPEED